MSDKTKPREHWGVSTAEFYAALQSKQITIALIDGKACAGEFVGVNRYDLIVKLGDRRQMLTPKHAVHYIVPPNTGKDDE